MQIGSLGDLAKSYTMQARNGSIQRDIQRLTVEISSGQVADIRAAVTGKTAYVNDITRSLEKLDAYDLATTEAAQFATGVQTALDRINTVSVDFLGKLLSFGNSSYNAASAGLDQDARVALKSVVGALNMNIAGRSVFAGTATDTLPIVDPDTLLSALSGVIAGAGSVDDMIAAAEAWFDDPAGFGTTVYQGNDQSLSPTAISDTETVEFDIKANDPTLREALRSLAMVALLEDPALGLTDPQKSEMMQKTVDPLLSANDKLVGLQARTGFSEGNVENVRTRNSAERSALEIALGGILDADPYTAATELEQVQFQLQSLYAITSRMSRLSLVNFL